MPLPAEYEPIADEELLYRRVPVSKGWIDEHGVRPDAFEPRADDDTGLSVYRARFVRMEDAAKGLSLTRTRTPPHPLTRRREHAFSLVHSDARRRSLGLVVGRGTVSACQSGF